ncbi:hypothetical protein OF376_02790 [Ureaplasma miroungigenitalium]|uniref:Lipoprotein n=1 Tax=Ureaplasma miroungigenitalium TaxID=1042321 RepID=A0ABT3BN52_9BACT|nr:hypothetical protein [Ureaplasma miroungigenitalium]MCV3728690.1 hypothetical protein [Ureaplasma miroungigenitalium]MCV3734381.1 hypothetical protein [Ureaplasma miroungigenitalium]
MKFKTKTKILTYLGLAALPVLTLPLAAFACKQTDDFLNQANKSLSALVKQMQGQMNKTEAEIAQINSEIEALKKQYSEASDEQVKQALKQQIEAYLASLTKDLKEAEYKEAKTALNLMADPRFNDPGAPYSTSVRIDNQVINGVVLQKNDENKLMCFDWLVLSDTNNFGHDHSHPLDSHEIRLMQNKKGDIQVVNFDNNEAFIDKTTGQFNSLKINDVLYAISKFDVNKVQLRIDGVGASTSAEKIVEVGKDQFLNSMEFKINDLAYLTNKQEIRITAISFQHTHHENIYNQWTIQFKDPIIVKVK